MINIAIVEDEKSEQERISSFLKRFGAENGVQFNIKLFMSGIAFLDSYKPNYDMVFMDIDMPVINGLETARQLRRLDTYVILFFVTSLAQFAINGYEFDAMDYLLKPLNYMAFSLKLKRAMKKYGMSESYEIMVKTPKGEVRFSSDIVIYVEINMHSILYHTDKGDYRAYGTMKQVIAHFPVGVFALCSSSYFVSLRHVTQIEGYNVYLNDIVLPISRPKRKSFIEALHGYYSAR